jgi:hypothetical protein
MNCALTATGPFVRTALFEEFVVGDDRGQKSEGHSMVSFAKDIRPLFTDTDVAHMKARGLDLSKYDAVKKHADAIYAQVLSGLMPPEGTGGVRWTSAQCNVFQSWQTTGYQP